MISPSHYFGETKREFRGEVGDECLESQAHRILSHQLS